jgi:hypothetical protein
MAGERVIDFDGTFFRGVKSDIDPSQLPIGYVWTAMNMLNLGGVLSCRPGYRCLLTLPDGNLQGAALFRPKTGIEQLMVAVEGRVYVAEYPFLNFRLLNNIQFSPTAKQIFWAQTTQSAERVSEDFTAAIRVIIPKAVMFMQDGGATAPGWYDGADSGHIRDHAFDTPAGGPMCWVGDRLWVAFENQVFASDIANPFSFREEVYLGGVTSFFFASDVTALVKTPSIESPQLMVFTATDGSILEANIRDRSQWPTTPNFQEEIIQVGCPSQRAAVSHYGRLVWFSPSGVTFFDPALSGKITTRLPLRDNEMLVSKSRLSEDLSQVAIGMFGQFLLVSVPAEDIYNRHTWVLNHASMETLSDDSGPSWSGYWTGTRPVEWVAGMIADAERIFYVSVDLDGKNRLWEAFRPERLDNGCPITWAFETRGYFGQTSAIQVKPPGERCRLAWADLALSSISEDLDLGVFYAGGARGAYKPILTKKISAQKGSLAYDQELTSESLIFAFKPQSRVVRTEDANQQSATQETGSCGIERADLESVDESFQLLVVGHGPATIRWIKPYAFLVPPDLSGNGEACLDETGANALRYDGVGAQADSAEEVTEELAAAPSQDFISSQTAIVSEDGITVIGAGVAESFVSQRAADRVAAIIAERRAEVELQNALPPITSIGEVFD